MNLQTTTGTKAIAILEGLLEQHQSQNYNRRMANPTKYDEQEWKESVCLCVDCKSVRKVLKLLLV
jgi:hypothetical protein